MDALRLEGRHASKPQSPSQPSHPRLPRNVLFIGLFIITPILAIAAVLEVALAAEGAKRGPSTDSFSGASFFTEPKNISQVLSDYPVSLFAAQDSLKLATGSLSLICAVILGGMLWHASTKGPIKTLYIMRLAVVVILGIDAVLSLATFLHSFITHGLSAHFDISHAMELANRPFYTAYDKGTFDLETWACETKDLPNYDSYPEGKITVAHDI